MVVSDIHDEGGRETVAQIESEGGRAAFSHADVRVEEQVRSLIEFAAKTFGALSAGQLGSDSLTRTAPYGRGSVTLTEPHVSVRGV